MPDERPNSGVLGTPDQHELETLAVRISQSPEVLRQKDLLRQRMLADPTASTPAGRATLENALDEVAFAQSLNAANSDPHRPKIAWCFTAPRLWMEHVMPGCRWGLDSPDSVYRHAIIDHQSSYEITVRQREPVPTQFSFMVYDSCAGENTKQKSDLLDEPMAALLGPMLEVDADGSYTVTVGPEPANGRPNHMQTSEGAKVLMSRDTFMDWANERTQAMDITRTAGPSAPPPRSEQEIAREAAWLLENAENILFCYKTNYFTTSEPNRLAKPWARGGGFAASSNARFDLGEDEAWVITLHGLGARGLGFGSGDPWMVSYEHITGFGTLNNNQAIPNDDGTYTYVVAVADPGVHNWIEPQGFNEGTLLVRWIDIPKSDASVEDAVRFSKVVKLDELAQHLPGGTVQVSAAERRAMRARRALEYARRYTA